MLLMLLLFFDACCYAFLLPHADFRCYYAYCCYAAAFFDALIFTYAIADAVTRRFR